MDKNIFIRAFLSRVSGKYQRTVSNRFYRRTVAIKTNVPIISFSFDDAPSTAFVTGGSILKANGVRGTFFVSLGLLGTASPSGKIASLEDLRLAVADRHELGCHTFDHQDSWNTSEREFDKSVIKNRQVLATILPDVAFTTFAYPVNEPRPAIKRLMGENFCCCRGGGQTFNFGNVDLNLLKAYFFDHRNRGDIDTVKSLIDFNAECHGWLIFATHDVSDEPSRYGCATEYFRKVVRYAVDSGALLLTVGKGCEMIQK